jgi:hypothetical protein
MSILTRLAFYVLRNLSNRYRKYLLREAFIYGRLNILIKRRHEHFRRRGIRLGRTLLLDRFNYI